MRQLETTVVSTYCTTLHHVNQPEAQQSGNSYEELARDNVCCVNVKVTSVPNHRSICLHFVDCHFNASYT